MSRNHPSENSGRGGLSSPQGAVLLRDEIERYCTERTPRLIDPFDENLLEPASYKLRLGQECRVDGDDKTLTDDYPVLKIPSHGLAVVSTLEEVNIPPDLIARWNLKVKRVYQGLLWVGSLQVDPGYSGKLFCPLYNLSNKDVHLELRDQLFTIDFVKTTYQEEIELWKPDRSTKTLKPLDKIPLQSGVKQDLDKMNSTVEGFQSRIDTFQSRIDTFQVITFTVLGIIVAALAFVSTTRLVDISTETSPVWGRAMLVITVSTAIAILVLTGVLAYAGIVTLNNKRTK